MTAGSKSPNDGAFNLKFNLPGHADNLPGHADNLTSEDTTLVLLVSELQGCFPAGESMAGGLR